MTPQDRQLVKRLAIAVAVKGVLLTGLWWAFVREHRVAPEIEDVTVRLLGPGLVDDKE